MVAIPNLLDKAALTGTEIVGGSAQYSLMNSRLLHGVLQSPLYPGFRLYPFAGFSRCDFQNPAQLA